MVVLELASFVADPWDARWLEDKDQHWEVEYNGNNNTSYAKNCEEIWPMQEVTVILYKRPIRINIYKTPITLSTLQVVARALNDIDNNVAKIIPSNEAIKELPMISSKTPHSSFIPTPGFTFQIISLGRFGMAGWLAFQNEKFYSRVVWSHIHDLHVINVDFYVYVYVDASLLQMW
jgi:hypothetical protein